MQPPDCCGTRDLATPEDPRRQDLLPTMPFKPKILQQRSLNRPLALEALLVLRPLWQACGIPALGHGQREGIDDGVKGNEAAELLLMRGASDDFGEVPILGVFAFRMSLGPRATRVVHTEQ